MSSVERPRVSSYCLNAVIRLSLTIRFAPAIGNFGRVIALGDGGCLPRATLPGVISAIASAVKSRRSCSSTCRRTIEVGSRGRARSLKPTADIDTGMRFSAIMPRSREGGLVRVPLEHLELVGIASNHEPMHWVRAFRTAHLALVLCHCRHGEAFLGRRPIRCCRLRWMRPRIAETDDARRRCPRTRPKRSNESTAANVRTS